MTSLPAIQASPDHAEQAFQFVTGLGFQLRERWISGGQSSRDGWRLSYASPAVELTVAYLDMQLEVVFTRSAVSADYWTVDRDLFARRSGYYGNMFPTQKLAAAIDRVAADIREHYGAVLAGDDQSWRRIQAVLGAAEPKGRLP